MATTQPTLCFTCGQEVGEPPRLNKLPAGSNCPACRDRLLDSLPALLPSATNEETLAIEARTRVARRDPHEGPRDWNEPPGEERF